MEEKGVLVPTAIDEYSHDLTWHLDDGSPAIWCNSEEERTALQNFVTMVLQSETIDDCLPLSEPLDDLCPVTAENLRVLKKALQKPGALLSIDKRLVNTFEEQQELAREGQIYGFAVRGISKEAFELLCRFFHSCVFNFEGDDKGWKSVNGARSEITSPEGDSIILRIVENDVQIETPELLIILVNGLPGYTPGYRIVDVATKNESKIMEKKIGTRTQVSMRIIADCLVTGEEMEYHWVSPIIEFAEAHRVITVM